MPEPTVQFELVGYYQPQISRRLVSSETACYVFHPNGRKSCKVNNRGEQDWFKTFDEAKAELVRRALKRIDALNEQVQRRLGGITCQSRKQFHFSS